MHIYHFHAIHDLLSGSVLNVDGILRLEHQIKTNDDYRKVRAIIAKGKGFPPDQMAISSLSYLGEDADS